MPLGIGTSRGPSGCGAATRLFSHGRGTISRPAFSPAFGLSIARVMEAPGPSAAPTPSVADAECSEDEALGDLRAIDDILRAALLRAGLVRAGWVAAALETPEDRDLVLRAELDFPDEGVLETARDRLAAIVLVAAVGARRRRSATASAPDYVLAGAVLAAEAEAKYLPVRFIK